MSKVLIDTCAWIDFFRTTHGVLGDFVASAIEKDQALLCGVVITELLQSAKGKKVSLCHCISPFSICVDY